MKEISLNVSAREKIGKSNAKQTRISGNVPAVVYGDKKKPAYIFLKYLEITKEMSKTGFFSTVFNLKMNKESVKVLPREIQTDPLSDKPIHIDFLRINENSKININVLINFINEEESPGLKKGGVLNVVRREVELSCNIKNIPEKLEVDLTDLEIGAVIHMSDIKLSEGVAPVISDRYFTIATVAAPTIMAVEEEPETEDEEGEEGEEGEGTAESADGEAGPEESADDSKDSEESSN